MNSPKRRAIEAGKTALILLLTLSALLLTTRAFLYTDAGQGGLLDRLLPGGSISPPPQPGASLGQGGVNRPVRMAVVNDNGRYAVQYDDAAVDELFERLGSLLGEALTSAQAPSPAGRQAWESALSRTGIYFDFLGITPLPLLASWLGSGEATPLTGEVSRLLLAQDQGVETVRLYYVDAQTGSYYSCETAVQFGDMLDSYIPNGAAFAFTLPDRYGALDPDVLLFPEPPAPPIYTGDAALDLSDGAVRDELLQTLEFTPQPNAIYPAAGGWRVLDGPDSLRLTTSGSVIFLAGEGEVRYPVSPDASRLEVIEATGRLVNQALASRVGSARLYLSSFTQENGVSTLTYSYSLSGAEVYLGQEGWCAQFTVSDGRITEYTLHLRGYTPTSEAAVLLPEFQAMAAMDALDAAGRSLLLCYYDGGTGPVAPVWTAR